MIQLSVHTTLYFTCALNDILIYNHTQVADTINEVSLSLGAAVMIAKNDNYEKWQLTVSNCKTLLKEERSNQDEV